ncbi:copper resistance CopC/CopD family protein [Shinella curvata]|uniref:Copper resistance CopC/CopD family protein n=1 Tax=Shinella curvata TaxID=1817964 RepID=A0ABT8XJ35_9HYPH|nr:copper resistance CopC/CopD family protein [Shinella curvata]MCJ8056123.1 copper resistance CopC/CopD family protein [Shinella curvata]MDO6123276.1 copper resistance CopC/CopD family protein [Shinella curvata]
MRNHHLGRFGLLALIAGLIWSCLTIAALAHASLTSATPSDGAVVATPPAMLSLSFSEPVSPLVLKLVRPDGTTTNLERFALRDKTLEITSPDDLGNGTYVMTWRVVSEDGHPVGGSSIFSIGAPSASQPAAMESADWLVRSALWISRIGLYAGLFLGIGGTFTLRWLISPTGSVRHATFALIAIGIIATLASAGLQGLDALGLPLRELVTRAAWATGFETSFGRTVLLLIGAFFLSVVALWVQGPAMGRTLAAIALIAGAAALALSGHASAAAPQLLMRPAVFLHSLTIAIWAGALLPLIHALRHHVEAGRAALARFARLIPVAVGILVIAGIVLAIVQVERPAALLDTAYGNVLLAKLGLILVLFLVVSFNRWALTKPAQAGDGKARHRLARVVVVETILVLAILAVASTWRFTPPPRALAVIAAQPVSVHIHAEKAMAEVTITPGRAGPVEVSAFVMAPDFSAMVPKEVVFVFSNPQAGVEPMRRKAALRDGAWRSEGVVLPLPGQWQLRVDVLISDFDLVRLQDVVEIQP